MALGSDILVENVSASAGLHNLVLRPEPRPILRSSAFLPFPSSNDRQHQVTCMYFSSLECTNTNKQITNSFLKISTFCQLKDLMSHFPKRFNEPFPLWWYRTVTSITALNCLHCFVFSSCNTESWSTTSYSQLFPVIRITSSLDFRKDIVTTKHPTLI